MSISEKFPENELKTLRDEIRHSTLDTFQSAQVLAAFLNQHGYGVSSSEALIVAAAIEKRGSALPDLQAQLEKIAWMM